MQPSNASSSSSSSSSSSEPLFRFFIYKVRNKIQKRIFDRNLFNYHLSLFSYFISFWKYFFSNNYSMMQSGKKKWHVSSESGRVDGEKNGSGFFFLRPCRSPSKVRVPLLCQYKHSKWTFSHRSDSRHNPADEVVTAGAAHFLWFTLTQQQRSLRSLTTAF